MTMLGSRRDGDPSQMGYQPPQQGKVMSDSNNITNIDSDSNNTENTLETDNLPFSSEE